MKVLPENILRLVSAEDRKKMGKAGMTAEECILKAEIKNESDLQRQIASLLSLKGIEFFCSRMDRKTTGKRGTPDFLFAIQGQAIAWECKLPGRDLEPHQAQMAIRLQSPPNGWRWRLITSVDMALAELREMGVE